MRLGWAVAGMVWWTCAVPGRAEEGNLALTGTLAGMLHLSDRAADSIMKGTQANLLIGSYLLLAFQWRGTRSISLVFKQREVSAGPSCYLSSIFV